MTRCPFCTREVVLDRNDPAYEELRYEEIGWVEQRKSGGGTHALELRKRTGRIAHKRCVLKEKIVPRGQETLF